jgi:hypothetical protein
VAVIVMLLYLWFTLPLLGFTAILGWLYVSPALLLFAMRVWFYVHRGALTNDPVLFALQDPSVGSWLQPSAYAGRLRCTAGNRAPAGPRTICPPQDVLSWLPLIPSPARRASQARPSPANLAGGHRSRLMIDIAEILVKGEGGH